MPKRRSTSTLSPMVKTQLYFIEISSGRWKYQREGIDGCPDGANRGHTATFTTTTTTTATLSPRAEKPPSSSSWNLNMDYNGLYVLVHVTACMTYV